ncbi:MAG: S9 family peptidase [Bacteroidia bacterium]
MKNYFKLLVLILLSVKVQSQQITLEDIWLKNTFGTKGVSGFNSLKDGRYYCALDDKQNLIKYEFTTGNAIDTMVRFAEIRQANNGNGLNLWGFTLSPNEKKLLIPSETESIYRHSTKSIYYVYDITYKKLTKICNDKVMYATFSPDENKVAYVKNNDLYYYHLNRLVETRITNDGKLNHIINGATDWVYEEEFGIYKGFEWSPNSEKIAFYRFNESKVKEFEMTIYGTLYPTQEKFKYPKAGEDNSIVNIYVYDLASELNTELDSGKETDIYLPRMGFAANSNQVYIQRLNRLQNKLEIILADANNGKSKVFYTETNKYYIDVTDNLTFINDGKEFILTSERDGYNHLYLYNINGKLVRQLTKGNFDIDAFYGYDEKTKRLFYSSSQKGATERYIYRTDLSGKNTIQLTQTKGWNNAQFNSNFTYFLNTVSTLNTPPVYAILNQNGQLIRVLEDNKELNEKLNSFHLSKAEFTTIQNSLDQPLNMYVIKPHNFDSTKKYPVLMYVYGGPGSQTVMNRWGGANYFWYQLLAQNGYMVVSIDGRGTGFKGEEFKKCTYLNLGKFEIEDQIFCAKKLGELPYVDKNRIGIWGWSFGGYMSSLGISKGADVFKAAIAVAPVTNWRYYDNIYTERFMRTPQENGKNYDDNSPINHVEKIKGNYLIIHGTADDNVHFQNAVEMVDAMIKKGVRFDSEFYPNKNHGIGGAKVRYHLYDRMTRFLFEKL